VRSSNTARFKTRNEAGTASSSTYAHFKSIIAAVEVTTSSAAAKVRKFRSLIVRAGATVADGLCLLAIPSPMGADRRQQPLRRLDMRRCRSASEDDVMPFNRFIFTGLFALVRD